MDYDTECELMIAKMKGNRLAIESPKLWAVVFKAVANRSKPSAECIAMEKSLHEQIFKGKTIS